MLATNHVVTGAAIGAIITNPIIGLPVALVAHFAMDAIPHLGNRKNREQGMRWLPYILVIDVLLSLIVLGAIIAVQPSGWVMIVAAAIVCASPDLMKAPFFFRYLRGEYRRPTDPINRFHSWIQWGERPWGVVVELVWLVLFTWLLWNLLSGTS